MKIIPFIKMDGLGNDFMIVDARAKKIKFSPAEIRKMGARKTGAGFDQLIILEKSKIADAKVNFFNSDGSCAGACGNGSRCAAKIIFEETGKKEILIEADGGKLLKAKDGKFITVNMGKPFFGPRLPKILAGFDAPVGVYMGNPHAVFFVKDIKKIDVEKFGPPVENNKIFPQKTNAEFAQVLSPSKIRMRVWERGAGITSACGSGACATLAAAFEKGLAKNKAEIIMDGGALTIEQSETGEILMAGPARKSFEGKFYL